MPTAGRESVMATAEGISSQEAAAALGINYRTLMRWVETGLLEPDCENGPARAKPARRWTQKHLREAGVLIRLHAANVPFPTIRAAMDYLRGLGQNPFSTGQFLVLGNPKKPGSVIKICDSGEVLDLVARGQLVLPLVPAMEEKKDVNERTTMTEKKTPG